MVLVLLLSERACGLRSWKAPTDRARSRCEDSDHQDRRHNSPRREPILPGAFLSGRSGLVVAGRTKPFSPQELLARIRAALRHAPGGSAEPLVSTGPLEVDFAGRTIRVHGHDVHLTGTEYEILRVLAANLGKVVTQRQLLQKVWGPQSLEQTQYLRVHVAQIRKKIEDDPSRPRLLITEPGVGYRLRDVSP
jgi:hypothetical protein